SAIADGNGNISAPGFYTVEDHDKGIRFFLTATGATSGHVARATFTDAPSADLDQCRNGTADDPNDCEDLGGASGWVNGNVGSQQGHLAEGLSIPYRVRLEEVPQGEDIDIYFSYDTKHSNRVAIDHLTHFQCLEPHLQFGHAAEVVDPTSGFDNGGTYNLGNGSTFPIPAPTFPNAPSDAPGFATGFAGSLNDCNRDMTIWGGTITQIAYDSLDNPGGGGGEGVYTDGVDKSTTFIRVRFTPTEENVLLAWGGHIASRVDWGFDINGSPRSAGGISGSPYHMRLEDWEFAGGPDDGDNVTNLGNQDRSLSADAIIPTGTIKIIKVTSPPNHPQDFTFTAGSTTGGAISPNNFELDTEVADLTLNSMISFTVLTGETYVFTETNIPTGWSLATRDCTNTDQGLQPLQQSIITDVGDDTIQIELVDGESFDCTFSNNGAGHIIVDKVTVPSGSDQVFEFDADGGSYDDFNLDDNDAPNDQSLIPGNYSVNEINIPAGWVLTDVTCVGSLGDPEDNTALELDPAETITCTFTNNKPDAKITLDPLEAVNRVGDNHIITATVMVHDGDGVFENAPDGTEVTFSLLNNDAGAVFVGGVNTCLTSSGSCSVTINSSDPGSVDIHAEASPEVLGINIDVATGTGGNNSADANKVYVDAKISIEADDTNEVDDPHTFTVTVEQNT
ncbi:MAG: prealbumin-like fold domain-containing protein, partial [Gammaproteobacteria bacterium]